MVSSKNSNSVICTIYGQKVTFVTCCSCNDSWYAFVTSTVIQHPFVDNLIGGIGYRLAIYGLLGSLSAKFVTNFAMCQSLPLLFNLGFSCYVRSVSELTMWYLSLCVWFRLVIWQKMDIRTQDQF